MTSENKRDLTPNGNLVLVAVNDIFFYSKIRDVLLRLGYKSERARSQEEVRDKAARLRPRALVINMNDDMNAMQAIKELKDNAQPGFFQYWPLPPMKKSIPSSRHKTWGQQNSFRNEFSSEDGRTGHRGHCFLT